MVAQKVIVKSYYTNNWSDSNPILYRADTRSKGRRKTQFYMFYRLSRFKLEITINSPNVIENKERFLLHFRVAVVFLKHILSNECVHISLLGGKQN